jgi:hypothetical protein
VVKEKTDEEKKKEAVDKTVEALQETPQAKALKDKVLADPLVKTVKDAVTSTPGIIATSAAAAGGVAALGATGKALPFQPPEIPLDKITPGLSAKVTYQGPVNAPTFVGLTVTYKEQGPKGRKTPESDKIAADIARLKAEQQMFKPNRAEGRGEAAGGRARAVVDQVAGRPAGLKIPLKGTLPTAEDAPKKDEETTPVQPAPRRPPRADARRRAVDERPRAPGRPLDAALAPLDGGALRLRLLAVRVHDDARAARPPSRSTPPPSPSARTSCSRRAATTRRARTDVRLFAHELTHVVQQQPRRRGAARTVQRGSAPASSSAGCSARAPSTDEELAGLPRRSRQRRDRGQLRQRQQGARDRPRWRTGGSKWVLTAKRKSVLIREMLSGATHDDDEQMILELLVRSFNAELRYIFTVGNVSRRRWTPRSTASSTAASRRSSSAGSRAARRPC